MARVQPGEIPDLTESIKMSFETFKHLATLNAGAIVLIGTFLQGIFPSQNGVLNVGLGVKLLIAASFVCFGLSLAATAYAMYRCTVILDYYLSATPDRGRYNLPARWARVVPLGSFWLGLGGFGLAVITNVFR